MLGVKPAGPHSRFHKLAVPFSVHCKSAVVSVILIAFKFIGSGQVGGAAEVKTGEVIQNPHPQDVLS